MAVGHILENPDAGRERYEQVMAHVRSSGPVPPEGARLVLSGPADPGWRVISVWDSREALERFFAERLTPAYEHAGLSLDAVKRTFFEVHGLVAGDLTGGQQSV
jgi:hypothetical protein